MENTTTAVKNGTAQKSKLKPGASLKGGSDKKRLQNNRINKVLNSYFHILTVIAVGAVLYIGYNYALLPKHKEVSGLIKANILQKEQLYIDKQKELNSLRKVVDVYRSLSPDNLKKFADLIPPQYQKEDLFTEVVYLVSKNGFTVDSIVVSSGNIADIPSAAEPPSAPGAAKRRTDTIAATSTPPSAPVIPLPSGVSKMSVKLAVGGVDYAGLRKLLGIFENNLRLLDISNLDFDPASKTVKLDLQTYYFTSSAK